MRVCEVTIAKKLHISTWGHVVWSTVEGVVFRLERERPRSVRATMSCRCIQEGIIDHVNPLVHEGVPVYMVRHLVP
jgi:hypothetical protein